MATFVNRFTASLGIEPLRWVGAALGRLDLKKMCEANSRENRLRLSITGADGRLMLGTLRNAFPRQQASSADMCRRAF
jgi:hypothetical protein